MLMIKHTCSGCGKETWHNPTGNKDLRPNGRCTYCGFPANPNNAGSSKRDYAILIQRKQAAKAGKLV